MSFAGFILRDTLSGVIAFEAGTLLERTEHALESMASEIAAYAQQNAPWNDRTGAARQGLQADVSREGTEVVLSLYHTVDYGQWLEVIQSGRFAIIVPTLEHYSAAVMRAVGAHETGDDLGDT